LLLHPANTIFSFHPRDTRIEPVILLYIHPMPLLSIRDLVKIYQTRECTFGKRKSAPSLRSKTAGLGRQILIYGLLIRPGTYLGFGTLRSR
jgi:hypothetical protein